MLFKSIATKYVLSAVLGVSAITTATYGTTQLLKSNAEAEEKTEHVQAIEDTTPLINNFDKIELTNSEPEPKRVDPQHEVKDEVVEVAEPKQAEELQTVKEEVVEPVVKTEPKQVAFVQEQPKKAVSSVKTQQPKAPSTNVNKPVEQPKKVEKHLTAAKNEVKTETKKEKQSNPVSSAPPKVEVKEIPKPKNPTPDQPYTYTEKNLAGDTHVIHYIPPVEDDREDKSFPVSGYGEPSWEIDISEIPPSGTLIYK